MNIYENIKDVNVSFADGIINNPYLLSIVKNYNKAIKGFLESKSTTVSEFEDDYLLKDDIIEELITEKLKKNMFYESVDRKDIAAIKKLIKEYFSEYKQQIYKDSLKYQKKRFGIRYNEFKITTMHELYKFGNDPEMLNIIIPNNAFFYLKVIDRLLVYYCKKVIDRKEDLNKVEYIKIK